MALNKSARKSRRWRILLLIALLLIGAGFAADRVLKGRRHPGLKEFARQIAVNYPASFSVDPITIRLSVSDEDLEQLQRVVEEARARGVILPEGNDYVPAEVEADGASFKAKVRIKGKLTDHVEGRKWSFRVIAKKDGGFQGMRRFSLQHPGTRNYLCDWFYHKLMAAEGVAALRYGFLRVVFNDEDLGVYAFEEHFGPELLSHNGRVQGPLFRYDPALFWEHRLNEMEKLRFDEPFAAYEAAALDAFGSSDLETDKQARKDFEEAVALMDGFRRGSLTASQVFDVDRIARHHAILDLVGGHHSMDFSDVKFYFDPVLKRVEPVSYESFSSRAIRTLAGSGKFVGHADPGMDLHAQWFNDAELFRAYVHHLERVSRKEWLDSTFVALKPALDSASATLYREFPYKELDRAVYYRNQQVIRKLIDPPKAFHAYLQDNGPDTVRVNVVPVEALPMEVHALVLADGTRIEPNGLSIIPIRNAGRPGDPIELRFAAMSKVERADLRIECSVLGASARRMVDVFPYALLDGADVARPVAKDPRALDFLVFDEAAKTITLKPGVHSIGSDVELPRGYRVVAASPLKLTIAQGARFLSRSPIEWVGLSESPIQLVNDGELVLLETNGRSKLERVAVSGAGRIVLQQAPASIAHCSFATTTEGDHITVVRSAIDMKETVIAGGTDGLSLTAAQLKAVGCEVRGVKDDGLVVRGGQVSWTKGAILAGKGAGVKLGAQSQAALERVDLRSADDAVEVKEGSSLTMTTCTLEAAAIGVAVKKLERISGPSIVELSNVTINAGTSEVDAGNGNSVRRDGKELSANQSSKGE